MGCVFPGVHLRKHWLRAFFPAQVPSAEVCGKLPESWLLWLPKEPREGPFFSTKPHAHQLLPSPAGGRKRSPVYILLPEPTTSSIFLQGSRPPTSLLTPCGEGFLPPGAPGHLQGWGIGGFGGRNNPSQGPGAAPCRESFKWSVPIVKEVGGGVVPDKYWIYFIGLFQQNNGLDYGLFQ